MGVPESPSFAQGNVLLATKIIPQIKDDFIEKGRDAEKDKKYLKLISQDTYLQFDFTNDNGTKF